MNPKTDDLIVIKNLKGTCSASFSAHYGGMMSSLMMQAPEGSRELLYFAPEFDFAHYQGMNGGAPFCFPICGRLMNSQYQYQGKIYEMGIHGFAYQMPWELLSHSDDQVILRLRDNAESLKHYPFQFEVYLDYQIFDNQLMCKQSYKNCGVEAMPYYAGFHPYLRLPFAKSETFLDYRALRRLQYNADLTDIIGEAPLFHTPANLLLPELNESLVQVGDDKIVRLNFPDGSVLRVEAQGVQDADLFSYVQLYHRVAEPFLCIEPWMSFPNAMNHAQGVRWLLPGQSEEGVFSLRLE